MKNINFGIDLGTTNSGIGRYENGKVQVLKNPVGLREILPSVVSFRKGRILVGDKAREQYLSNATNVFSAFKRKVGTSETYEIIDQDTPKQVSPVELSAYVLKELKNYIYGENVDAVVITIPASFDTIQSNATKQAGYQAGFTEVVLLQEPVAACLAYANTSHLDIEKEQKWMVYDFGGGTLDVALVHINQRELKVIDNKGNNFLGGVDIDYTFIEQTIAPRLAELTGDPELWTKLTGKQGIYEKLWHYLNYLAEESKKQLSVVKTTWIEIDFPELDLFHEFEITRDEFNLAVKPSYLASERFIIELLRDNNLSFTDIERIILVGGTTYIPFIKDSLKAVSNTNVDDSVDPTTAVIVGATYYAGSYPVSVTEENQQDIKASQKAVDIKLSFEAFSNDIEELIAFKTLKPFNGAYRINRTDGGFDTGVVSFVDSASQFVTLLPKTKNVFSLSIFDQKKRMVHQTAEIIISHGLYNVSGQLLPGDICIELDNKESTTYLEVIFKRNSILPLKKLLYKTFSRSILKNTDDRIVINVVEGKGGTLPGANLSIGYIEVTGKQIQGDVIQGTDIEITVAMDESRGLTVEIYIPSLDQEIKQTFHIENREVSINNILNDIKQGEVILTNELVLSNAKEDYELSAAYQDIFKQFGSLKERLALIADNKATEERYRLDEQKRALLIALDDLTRARDIYSEITFFEKGKKRYQAQQTIATNAQIREFANITDREKEVLRSNDKHLIKKMADELEALNNKIFLQNDENFVLMFYGLKLMPEDNYNNYDDVAELFQTGLAAIQEKNYVHLKHIVTMIFNQLKDEHKRKKGKGINADNLSILKTGLK